jgi:hypothetical protein
MCWLTYSTGCTGTRDDPPGDEAEPTENGEEDGGLTPATASLASASGFRERAHALGQVSIRRQEIVLPTVALSRRSDRSGDGGCASDHRAAHGEQCERGGEQHRAEPMRWGGEVGVSHVLCLPSGA